MNKKMIALALAAAFAAPAAFADSGTVKVSGYLNLSIDYLDRDAPPANANSKSQSWFLSSNRSKIVFSGDEPLGNGLKAIWQMTNFVTMGSSPAINGGTLTSGNSFLGLQGGWGTFLAGRNDTPMKILGRKLDLFANQVGDSRNVLSTGSSTRFDNRPGNIVQYNSPAWSGFQMSAQLAAREGVRDNDSGSVSVGYENGPLLVGAAFERHNPGVGGVGAAHEEAWRLGAGYSFGNTRLVGLYQQAEHLSGIAGADRNAWGLGVGHKMGANTIKAQYYRADDLDNVSNSGADMWALGWDYALSKRTTAYVAYARASNDANNGTTTVGGVTVPSFTPYGTGRGDTFGGTGAGETDPSGFSVGMVHKF